MVIDAGRVGSLVPMTAIGLSRLCTGRVHYAWIVLAVMFSATLAGVGVRAAPGVMILPLQRAFGWDVSTISGAVSVNIILLGVTDAMVGLRASDDAERVGLDLSEHEESAYDLGA